MKTMSRRKLLHQIAALGFGLAVASCSPKVSPTAESPSGVARSTPASLPLPTSEPAVPADDARPTAAPESPTEQIRKSTPVAPSTDAYLAVARGPSPEEITKRVIIAIGGIERFVKPGHDVIIKPNICNANRGPEYASTTNPEVVATLTRLCLGAGAKRVRVMDYPFAGSAQAAYIKSGIGEAVKAAGGTMEIMSQVKFVETEIPEGLDLKSGSVYEPILDADLVINVPIAKDHSLARLTLAGKNLMGVIQERPRMHQNLGQRIADITSLVRPQLTIVDAVRILMDHGPTGGNLADVKMANTVIASHDLVAADAYATTLFGLTADDIAYIGASAAMGLGTMDLESIKIAELNV